MKKITYIIACCAFLCSCAKPRDWNCSCDYTNVNGSYSDTKVIEDKKQGDANSECTAYGKALSGGNGTYKCKLEAK